MLEPIGDVVREIAGAHSSSLMAANSFTRSAPSRLASLETRDDGGELLVHSHLLLRFDSASNASAGLSVSLSFTQGVPRAST